MQSNLLAYFRFGPYETDATISFEEKTLLIQ